MTTILLSRLLYTFQTRVQNSLMSEATRTVLVNKPNPGFCSNVVKNTKYTPLNFLFKNLYEQFRQPMNLYFLLIATLQLNNAISVNNPLTTWLPLLFIFSVSAIRELSDDLKRSKADKITNNKLVKVLRGEMIVEIPSKDIQVGDVLYITENEEIPSDCVVLYSSNPNGICYIQTTNIDGETNLKLRTAVPSTQKKLSLNYAVDDVCRALAGMDLTIDCPVPNSHIYQFPAVLHQGEESTALSSSSLFLQVCHLRNTEYILAACVYTGNETKFGMNKNVPQMKLTHSDRMINWFTVAIFCFQLCLAIVFGICGIHNVVNISKWYIENDATWGWKKAILIPLRFILLNSSMIPISLKVTIEVCKVFYSIFINNDEHFADEATKNKNVFCNSSCLSENLGHVRYIFSDKTGTLTKNEMILKYATVFDKEIAIHPGQTTVPIDSYSSLNSMFTDYIRCILLCNSIVIDKGQFKCDSPDELCLVSYCKHLGGELLAKNGNNVTIQINNEQEEWVVEKTLEFSSERKRMSVLAMNPSAHRFVLFSKGADDMILARSLKETTVQSINLAENYDHLVATLKEYANQGLRTLVMAMKDVSEAAFKQALKDINAAETVIENREEVKAACYETIEKEMIPVGISGIEDLLQDDVYNTIDYLRQCGVSVWMITGDKPNTAVSIGRSTGIIDKDTRNEDVIVVGEGYLTYDSVISLIHDAEEKITSNPSTHYALCVTGNAFSFITTNTPPASQESLVTALVRLAMKVSSVIFCRVFPKQKSEVVQLMKKETKQVCLGIGDGGNDVIMIQNSDVGVGIIGKEGQQAARAADYVIIEFKHLKRLMTIHGVNSLSRSWTIGVYSFYKSMIFCLIQTSYAVFSSYSGVTLFNSMQVTLYNIFLFIPIVSLVTKKLYDDHELLNNPSIYSYYNNTSAKSTLFTFKEFAIYMLIAIIEAVVLEQVAVLMAPSSTYDYLANTIFWFNLFGQDLIMAIFMPSLTWLNVWMIVLCHVLMWGICFVGSSFISMMGLVPYLSMQFTQSLPIHYWSSIVLVLLPLVFLVAKKIFWN